MGIVRSVLNRQNQGFLLAVALLVALALTGLFTVRAFRHMRWMRYESQSIRPWMSVPFVAHTRHVPAATLFQAIGLDPYGHDHRPLRRIAHEQRRPVSELISELERAIDAARSPGVAPPTPPISPPR